MAKPKKPVEEEVKDEAADSPEAAAEAPAEAPAKGAITVKYRDHKGETTERTFSKEVHGKDFAKLAEEFKETNKSRIIIE